MGPSGLPMVMSEMPTATAMTRMHDRNTESPMPESGPMRAALTDEIAAGSSSPLATRSSMEATMPPTKGWSCGVTLKNSMWRESADL